MQFVHNKQRQSHEIMANISQKLVMRSFLVSSVSSLGFPSNHEWVVCGRVCGWPDYSQPLNASTLAPTH